MEIKFDTRFVYDLSILLILLYFQTRMCVSWTLTLALVELLSPAGTTTTMMAFVKNSAMEDVMGIKIILKHNRRVNPPAVETVSIYYCMVLRRIKMNISVIKSTKFNFYVQQVDIVFCYLVLF